MEQDDVKAESADGDGDFGTDAEGGEAEVGIEADLVGGICCWTALWFVSVFGAWIPLVDSVVFLLAFCSQTPSMVE